MLRARHRWDRFVGPEAHDDAASYEGRHGLLLEDPTEEDGGEPGSRAHRSPRWMLSAGVAAVVLCVLGVGAGLWWWSSTSNAPDTAPVEPPDTSRPASKQPSSGATAGAHPSEGVGAPERQIVVHVAGAVARPGVYRLAEGSRIHEALAAAGGALPDGEPDRLNLAATADDGARIAVPRRGEPTDGSAAGSAQASAGTSAGGTRAKVNLNTASAEELAGLPRVGPVLAQRIVEFRQQHGRFSSPEDLDAVPGIGTKMLESLLPLVSV